MGINLVKNYAMAVVIKNFPAHAIHGILWLSKIRFPGPGVVIVVFFSMSLFSSWMNNHQKFV